MSTDTTPPKGDAAPDTEVRDRHDGAIQIDWGQVGNRVLAYAVLAVGIALIVVAHWPGRLDPDSIANLDQALSGWISDHRSAVTTWLWRQAYLVFDAGPGVALLTQTTMLAVGCYLVLRSVYGRIVAAALSTALLLAPPTFGFVGLVGRDVWFVAPCILGVGIAVTVARTVPRGRLGIAGLWVLLALGAALGALAVATRQNGVAAVLPVMVVLAGAGLLLLAQTARLPTRIRSHPILSAITIGVLATAIAGAGTLAATSAIRSWKDYPEVYTQLWDLGYMTMERSERFIPSLPRNVAPVQTISEVRERWRPTTSIYMRWSDDFQTGSEPFDAETAKVLARAWRTAILDHPLTYLEGRFSLWKSQLGIGHTPWYSMVVATAQNPHGLDGPHFPALSDMAVDYATFWAAREGQLTGSTVHHAWMYLLACIAGLALLASRFPPQVRAVGALGAVGIGVQVGLFFLAPSVQWRYQLLTVYAGMLIVLVSAALLVKAAQARRSAARAPTPPAAPSR